MKYIGRLILVISLCVSIHAESLAQKGMLKTAYRFFNEGNYVEALSLFDRVENIDNNKTALYRRGLSNFYTNHIDQAVEDFTKAYKLGVEDPKVYYYVGKSMHYKGDFKGAAKFYKTYLQYVEDTEEQQNIINELKRCAFGIDMAYEDQLAFVENLGSSVNSIHNEIHPVQSPTNPNKYYFSANRDDATGGLRNAAGYKDEIFGKYSMDMYAVELKDGNWTAVNAFHPILNSPKNDILLDFNPSGTVMYYYKSLDMLTGTIYTDTFAADRPENVFPRQLECPSIPQRGDKDLKIFSDSIIIFSSARDGGYGGYDLYISRRKNDGWMPAQNLGPDINGPYDDISPFLAKSGTKLYFSSNRLESIGGFDIFSATYNNEINKWEKAKNVAAPINSTKNELDFTVSSDGMTGVFSSDRIGSKGGYDIYFAYMKDQVTEQLMYTEELPFLDKSGILVESNDSLIALQKIKSVTKKREYYNTPLYYGSDENILTPQNINRLDAIVDLMIIYPKINLLLTCHSIGEGYNDFDLYFSIKRSEKAAEYLIKKGIAAERIYLRGVGANFPLLKPTINGRESRLANRNNRRIDISFFNIPSDNLTIIEDATVVKDDIKDYRGEVYADKVKGLSYKIEICQVKQIYKGDILKKYDEASIEKRADSDTYTYTLGLFDNYNEAKTLKNVISRQGIDYPKIVPYIDGMGVEKSELDTLKTEHPDLGQYILYEQQP